MQQHFIHYLPRKIVMRVPSERIDPWFSEGQGLGDGFSRPKYHKSRRATGPACTVRPGDTIWLVSQIYSPWGVLPPGIDARVDVDRIEEQNDGALRFVGSITSAWFALADATSVLATLESIDASGKIRKIRSNARMPIGHNLQSMRRLTSGEPLSTWSKTLEPQHTHFISYRIRDGTATAFLKVRELLGQGEVVFWDRWCLPRRLAKRREVVDDKVLDDHLMEHLRKSRIVWGIESEKYFESGSYSSKEHAEAISLGTYRGVKIK